MADRAARSRGWAQEQRERWAVVKAVEDRELLSLRDSEKLTYQRIGTRLGISRVAARYRYLAARRREALRALLGTS